MYKCGAVVSSSKHLLPSLTVAASLVREILYVPIHSEAHEEDVLSDLAAKVNQVYFHVSKLNPTLQCRIVLPSVASTPLYYSIDALISPEKTFQETKKLPQFTNIFQRAPNEQLETLFKNVSLPENVTLPSAMISSGIIKSYSDVALGGTFDSIHTGHCLLLSHAALISNKRILVGIADGPLLDNKVLPEFIKPVAERVKEVRNILEDTKPGLQLDVVPITDVYGPTAWDNSLNCLIVTPETLKGADKINQERAKSGLPQMDVFTVQLIKDGSSDIASVNDKLSSSDLRKNQLGKYRLPKIDRCLKDWKQGPYLIGFTGSTGSGKSSVIKRLTDLGAYPIDCDKLGHEAYIKGTTAYHKIIDEFGESILDSNGEINRKALGPIVFSDKSKLNKLNEIVWPEILKLAKSKIQKAQDQGYSVCILDAAVLLQAQWDRAVHEVWATIIPIDESIKRVIKRDSLSDELARKRVSSQTSNKLAVDHAHVVFCTLWEYQYTQQQVDKAWTSLTERIKIKKSLL